MSMTPYDPDDPCSPLVTLSVLDVPISADTRCGDEVHLTLGPVTLILLTGQAAEVVTVLRATTE